MTRRVTIVIDDDLDKMLRLKQASIIRRTSAACSYSKVINKILRKGLK